jgi:argininosuccinate lyase
VRAALERGKRLSELGEEELRELAPQLDGEYYELLREGAWLESKRSRGGTSLARVREQLDEAKGLVGEAG